MEMIKDYLAYLTKERRAQEARLESLAAVDPGARKEWLALEGRLTREAEGYRTEAGEIDPSAIWKHVNYHRGKYTLDDPINWQARDYHVKDPWFNAKKLILYHDDGVTSGQARTAMHGVMKAITTFGLPFIIDYRPDDEDMLGAIRYSRSTDGSMNASILESTMGTGRGEVILISDHNENEPGMAGRSSSRFSTGLMIHWGETALDAAQGAGRLFGIPGNHGSRVMDAYAGDYDTSGCVMNEKPKGDDFCGHCRDRVTYFWRGIEDLMEGPRRLNH